MIEIFINILINRQIPNLAVGINTLSHNGLKQTIFVSSGLEPLEMISDPDIGRCASENVDPQESKL